MDEYFCDAYPDPYTIDLVSEKPSSPKDQCFNVEIKHTETHVLNARKFETFEESKYHSFKNISKDEMMQETTILGWLSSMTVPKDAHKVMVAKILDCARGMTLWTHKDKRVLYIRVDITITIATEECHDNDDDDNDDIDDSDDNNDNDYDEDDQELRFVPASNSSIESLETVNEQEGCVNYRKCAICFEDINVVSVQMPCLHKFHKNCIVDWLNISAFCPLCRFLMPTEKGEKDC
ncbi:hypothetical protein TanjilG_08147 [Lupinus angustifolius]|uniref:RING-type E3 ubiquitin transferase n=1 Tax=Lupinus angustifolius TaxID=3871 RepID=A0A4P1RLR3_LUPAN|nr:PREDICTED: E3 ubiquitin-protein ligase At1g12760-like [Lupinus angustifolius]OIW13114.1 hypothetical protein TanjilG_08147 [Lupinus angustifolius]